MTILDIEADKPYGYKPLRNISPAYGQIYMSRNVPSNPRDGEIYFNPDTETTYRYNERLKVWGVVEAHTQLDKIRQLAGLPLPGEKVKPHSTKTEKTNKTVLFSANTASVPPPESKRKWKLPKINLPKISESISYTVNRIMMEL